MNHRLFVAMACYGMLALGAAFTLDRLPRTFVLLLLGALAVRTWIATKRQT